MALPDFHHGLLALSEFNDEQIQRYLIKRGLAGSVPDWMPSRPLLVGYLAASGVLEEAFSGKLDKDGLAADPARAWDYVLDLVCEREADIEAGIDGATVRRILERLATLARQSQSGLGPLSAENIASAFLEICGYQPDEKGFLLLQRLPGLGIDRNDEGTRIFSDEAFVDVCRAGDVLHCIDDPFGGMLDCFRGADRGIGDLGAGVILLKAGQVALTGGKMVPAIKKALMVEKYSSLVLDLVRVSIEFGLDIAIPVRLADLVVPYLEFSSGMKDLSNLTFSECLFPVLAIDHEVHSANLPRFIGCYIEELEGRSSVNDLPPGVFDKQCEFGRFADAPDTTSAIVATDLPAGARVLLTVLKKLYSRSGAGRRENALQRGLDHHSRRLVGSVLRLLQSEGLITPYKGGGMDMTIWIPDRSKMRRVQKLITSPRTCGDALIQKASNLA